MRDLISEITASICNNKLRIALTGFSIGWGLFILIVLLGTGNGLMNGIVKSFGSDTICVIRIKPGVTQLPWQGLGLSRQIRLTQNDGEAIMKILPKSVQAILPINSTEMLRATVGQKHIKTIIQGIRTDCLRYQDKHITKGRDIAPLDLQRCENVCLIGEHTAGILFSENTNPIGKKIEVGPISFLIVGVYTSDFGSNIGHTVFAPFTTIRKIFKPDGELSQLTIVAENINTEEDCDRLQMDICKILGERLHFNPEDRAAIVCNSYFLDFLQLKNVLRMLQIFIWVIGIATLIAGVVGISNIMLISVRERRRELGIRKAMGATDRSIIILVLSESVVVSLVFGYVGMMIGVGLTQFIAWILMQVGGVELFDNPTVSLTTVVVANLIMVLAGLVAGYFPARNVVQIKLIDVLTS